MKTNQLNNVQIAQIKPLNGIENNSTQTPLLLELREKMEYLFSESNGTLTNTGGATDTPGHETWDEDYDGD